MYIKRETTPGLKRTIEKGKSILLLGPRQVGKSTLINRELDFDLQYTLLEVSTRQQFEKDPDSLLQEIKAHKLLHNLERPIVYIDEVQLVPALMNVIQLAVDRQEALFILTGSSARKLIHHRKNGVNLLPGRLLDTRLSTLSTLEMPQLPDLKHLLLYGSLPEVYTTQDDNDKERLLQSYVHLYLEQEVRAEGLVRQLGRFSEFLALAAIESGNPINISKLASDIGVSRHTINAYFDVLEDCLILDKIIPITHSVSRRKLRQAPKYLFFDMGVRRLSAGEGIRLPQKYWGSLFEQQVGIICLQTIRNHHFRAKLKYWHDHSGAEVDFVIEAAQKFLPIEVKYTTQPSTGDAKHLKKFLAEYPCYPQGLIVCQTPRPKAIADNILAIPWQSLAQFIHQTID